MQRKSDIKVVILAGGLGTRLGSLTKTIPKPMIKVANKPLLDHIIYHYQSFNFTNFLILTGYLKDIIHSYYKTNKSIKCIDTGLNTQTAGRIFKVKNLLTSTFMVTYGDGLSDINLDSLLDFHYSHKSIATLTAVSQPNRFGVLSISHENRVTGFKEKPLDSQISGGFFVFEPQIFDYINSTTQILEKDILPKLVNDKQLYAYKHSRFWACVDTERDKGIIEKYFLKSN